MKIFSYQLNVDTNVHIYIFCNKHFRCLQLHFIYKAYPYTHYVLLFHFFFFFSSFLLSYRDFSFLVNIIPITIYHYHDHSITTLLLRTLLLPNTISSSNSSRSHHRSYRLSSVKFYFLHYIVARHTLCTYVLNSVSCDVFVVCVSTYIQRLGFNYHLFTTCTLRCDYQDTESMEKKIRKRSTRRFFYRSPLLLPSTFLSNREKILSSLCFFFFSSFFL